jgi:hypothetical protein
MSATTLKDRIDEVADGNIGVLAALLNAQTTLGDKKVAEFLDKVPERGEKLWLRFKALQTKKGDFITFNHLIASVLFPQGLAGLLK